jgi:hypothetical protein
MAKIADHKLLGLEQPIEPVASAPVAVIASFVLSPRA